MNIDMNTLDEVMKNFFPDGFTLRDEANAITAYCFRNGFLEDLHAGETPEFLNDNKYSRITQEEMKELMVESSYKVFCLLQLKETDPEKYQAMIKVYGATYSAHWKK
jgi:hypothetical protein